MNACHPDYVGFVFASSRRQVSAAEAKEIAGRLDPDIRRVGVFAGNPPDEVARVAAEVGLFAVQLHFDTTPEYFSGLKVELRARAGEGIEIWQRIAVPYTAGSASDILTRTVGYPPLSSFDALLFDVVVSGKDGGSGVPFPWKIGKAAVEALRPLRQRIIVAGGINARNVREAIQVFSPYAVDASGSLETDGYKDRDKVEEFIRAVRERRDGNE